MVKTLLGLFCIIVWLGLAGCGKNSAPTTGLNAIAAYSPNGFTDNLIFRWSDSPFAR